MKSKVLNLLRELKCATALEIAMKLNMSRKVVQMRLNRLAAKGFVEKRILGKRAVIYCYRTEEGNRGRRVKRGVSGLYTKTRERLTRTLEILQHNGCISVGMLMRIMDISHTKAYYMLHVLLLMRLGVKLKIGKTAILCRDRAAAEETVTRIREVIHRLAVENGMKYATAVKVLQAALRDGDAYKLLSRFIPLRHNMRRFPPLVLTFVKDVLESLYGEPLKAGNKHVYIVAPRPRAEHGIEIIDHADVQVVTVSLPSDLAVALQGADINELVLQALEQLLQRYKP
jgi:DNA-binding Lrp family transcriptional regulator